MLLLFELPLYEIRYTNKLAMLCLFTKIIMVMVCHVIDFDMCSSWLLPRCDLLQKSGIPTSALWPVPYAWTSSKTSGKTWFLPPQVWMGSHGWMYLLMNFLFYTLSNTFGGFSVKAVAFKSPKQMFSRDLQTAGRLLVFLSNAVRSVKLYRFFKCFEVLSTSSLLIYSAYIPGLSSLHTAVCHPKLIRNFHWNRLSKVGHNIS